MSERSLLHMIQVARGDRSTGSYTIPFVNPQEAEYFANLAVKVVTHSMYDYHQGFVPPEYKFSVDNSAILGSHDMASVDHYLRSNKIIARFDDFVRNSLPKSIFNNDVYTISLLDRGISEGFAQKLITIPELNVVEDKTFETQYHNGTPRVEITEIGKTNLGIRFNKTARDVLLSDTYIGKITAPYKEDPSNSITR